MPKLSHAHSKLLEGQILLYKRPDSRKWQAVFKVGGYEMRLSTRRLDKVEASSVALDLRQFIASSRDGKIREMRLLLLDYALILANSGIRHGTEADNLCWRHIRIVKERGREVLLFYVDVKTGGRELGAQGRNPEQNRRLWWGIDRDLNYR